MISKILYSILSLIFVFGLLSQSFVGAETNDNESGFVINETKIYKDTEITLEHLMVSHDKITVQLQLHGKQVENLILNKKGDVYVHEAPNVIVIDDKGLPLKISTKKVEKPNKEKIINRFDSRIHNISANAIEVANSYKTKGQMPEFLTIKVMELNKGDDPFVTISDKNTIAEFKVDL